MNTIKRLAISAALSTAVVGGTLVATAPPASAAYCGITWGSMANTSATMSTRAVIGTRAGQHACFDRFVIDVGAGSNVGYSVQYVSLVHSDGSGAPVPVAGGAVLQVVVRAPANASTKLPPAAGQTFTGYSTLRQVKFAGSFEGQTTYALGVRARLPMRVMVVTQVNGVKTVVIDVAHRW